MNILLTSCGRRTYLIHYFKAALGGEGEVYAANSIMTYSLTHADDYVITPEIFDENYIGFLLDYCIQKEIAAIIPLIDIDLPVLARNKKIFSERGVSIIVSDERVTMLCNDKWATYNYLEKLGISQPKTCIDLDSCYQLTELGEMQYPLILKPRWGMGSIGIYKVDNQDELKVLFGKLMKEIFSTPLRYESSGDAEHCILIQEFIDGQEYGIQILNDLEGNYVATVAQKKVAMRAGETDIAEIVDSGPFEPVSIKLANELRHIGNMDIDCFIDKDGELIILELNCRFGGQYPFAHLSGTDFPAQIVKWLNGGVTDAGLCTPKNNITGSKDLVPVSYK